MKKNTDKHFGGYFDFDTLVKPFAKRESHWFDPIYIEKVIYNNPATIVFWNDGTKTTSKCNKLDKYNPEIGLYLAVMKKFSKNISNLYDDWGPLVQSGNGMWHDEVVTISDVRKKNSN